MQDKKPYQKPLRKCIYCHKMSSKLTRHIKTQHKDVQRVKDALLMKKESTIIEFQKIRRERSGCIIKEKLQRNILCFKENGNRECIKNLLNAVHVSPFYEESFLVYTKRVAG